MYLQKFPDINWLRRNASQNFSRGMDQHGNPLPSSGWPNVILNTRSFHTERDNIVGPFSLFYNLSGLSKVQVENNWHQVSDGFYCISNQGQSYDLHVPKEEQVETFNIHFGQSLFKDVMNQFIEKQPHLLDNSDCNPLPEITLLPKTDLVSHELHTKLLTLHQYKNHIGSDYSSDTEYELTATILEEVLSQSLKKLKKMNPLNSAKLTTKKELLKRISIGIDYMHDHRFKDIDLKGISCASGLSKFHFIRVFKEIYGYPPTTYLSKLKLKKAIHLLKATEQDLSGIALQLGFSELSAFSRFIKRETGKAPSSLRSSN